MFVLRMLQLLKPKGYVGAISSRTIFFQSSSENWRKEALFKNTSLPVFLDLGPNVMDNALVESAAYVIGVDKTKEDSVFINITNVDKTVSIADFLRDEKIQIIKKLKDFDKTLGSSLVYFLSDDILKLYACDKNIFVNAKQGLATGDNERFVRLFWEVNNRSEKWFPLAKGGDACPFYGNVPTEVNWEKSGNEISNFNAAVIRNKGFYFRPALTWTLRANSLSLRVFPKDGIFDRGGSCVFVEDDSPNHLLSTLALLNSRAFQNLIAAQLQMAVGNSRYECGMLSSTPFPVIKPEDGEVLSQWAKQNFEARRKLDSVNEESRFFLLPEIIQEALEAGTIQH